MMTQRELSILRDALPPGADLSEAVRRVEAGEPLAYVIGEWYFYGLTFKLNRHCLIPRPDTEHTVEAVIGILPKEGRFADLCAGSGCIGISVLKNRPDAYCDALEISPEACEAIRLNGELNGVSARMNTVNADVFTYSPTEKYDIIVSNPPYIRSSVIPTLDINVQKEPRIALDGGEDGMRFYRAILTDYAEYLNDGGSFVFEIGYDQREQIEALALQSGYGYCRVTKDYGGNDRVAVIRRHA